MRGGPCDIWGCSPGVPPMRPQFVDMEGWTLLSSDRQVVPHKLQAEAELLHANLQQVPEAFPELYWQAPPSYLGDRVSRHTGPREVPTSREAWGLHECAQAQPQDHHGRLWARGQVKFLCLVSRCHPTVGPSAMNYTRRASGETCSPPWRAGQTCCCRWPAGWSQQGGRRAWPSRDSGQP